MEFSAQHGRLNTSASVPINVSDNNYLFDLEGNNDTVSINDYEQIAKIMEDFRKSLYRTEDPVTIVLITCYIVVFVSALLGNLMVLLVILSNKSMRTSITNSYLLNLAVADLLVTLVCIPLTVGENVYRVWVYSYFLCKATNYLQGLCISASVLTIMALSLDRYVAIRHPVRSRQTSSAKCVRITIFGIWVVSGAIMVPLVFVRSLTFHVLSVEESVAMCGEHWPSDVMRTAFDIFLFVFIYIIPGTVVIFSYSSTGCTLMTGDTILQRTGSEACHAGKVIAGRKRLARMLLVLAILFAISWMPYHAVNLYMDISSRASKDASPSILSYALLLGHSHSAQNPVLYCFMNSSFKRGLRNLMRCRTAPTVATRTATWRCSFEKSRESNTSHQRQGSQNSALGQCKDARTALLGDELVKSNTLANSKRHERERKRSVSFECDTATELSPLKRAIVEEERVSNSCT